MGKNSDKDGRLLVQYDRSRWIDFLDYFYPITGFREVAIPERITVENHSKSFAIIRKYFGQRPLFMSLFSFFQKYEPLIVDRVWWDIDNINLKNARKIAENVADIGETYVFFSGGKGFHVYLFGEFDWSEAKLIWQSFSKYTDKVFDKARVARIPFTVHEKTGMYVIPVHPDDEMDDIIRKAKVYTPPYRYSQMRRYKW